jgi:hypothetical protein
MVTQYPHTITITPAVTTYQDNVGNIQRGRATTPVTYDCRAEPAGSNPVIKGADGADVIYAWIVYMAAITVEYTYGDQVAVTLANGTQYDGFIKRQANGQLNTRLWV